MSADHPFALTFSKIVLAPTQKVKDILFQDKNHLQLQYEEAVSSGETESIPFIEQALALITVSFLFFFSSFFMTFFFKKKKNK